MAGEIEFLPVRNLAGLVGHDADGVVGRQSVTSALFAIPLPANAADYPLSAGQRYGQVATNSRFQTFKAGANKSFQTRSHHTTRTALTELAIVLPNCFADESATKLEWPNEGSTMFGASIEYPAGVYTRLVFGKRARATVSGGMSLVSDFLPVSIPNGAEFWICVWCLSVGTTIATAGPQNTNTGEIFASGATAVPDRTMTGPTGSPSATAGLWPVIISRTVAKTAILFGSSSVKGVGDSVDASDGYGLSRAYATTNPYIIIGQSGDSLAVALAGMEDRLALLRFGRNVIAYIGGNDVTGGAAPSSVQAMLLSFWGQCKDRSGGRVFQPTFIPVAGSSDSWATLVNQTPDASDPVRITVNDWIRDGAPIVAGVAVAVGTAGAVRAGSVSHPLYGYMELADVVESARNSGKWKVDGTPNKYTADGTHNSPFGYLTVATSGALSNVNFI